MLSDSIARQLRRLGAAIAVGVLVLAGWAGSAAPALAETHEVLMGSDRGRLVFVPEELHISPGDTVRWVMNNVPPHNVVFEADKAPEGSATLAKAATHEEYLFRQGEAYESAFPEDAAPGTYPYFCRPHRSAGMVGSIVIDAE